MRAITRKRLFYVGLATTMLGIVVTLDVNVPSAMIGAGFVVLLYELKVDFKDVDGDATVERPTETAFTASPIRYRISRRGLRRRTGLVTDETPGECRGCGVLGWSLSSRRDDTTTLIL